MTSDELVSRNPFPGLRPFDTPEAERFFGRRQQIDEVLAQLFAMPFVAVSGASGCGKSSLVRAGVLSRLSARGREQGTVGWKSVVVRPGNAPIANLAGKLSPVLARDGESGDAQATALHGRLRLGSLGLIEAVRTASFRETHRLLIVVDQFEELFRFQEMTDPDEASAFVKLLLAAARDPGTPITIVITLRSDALGACANFRDLPEAVSRGLYLVPRMTRDQRRDAIVEPIELRGAHIAPRLVQRILNDVSDSFDDLPVMQHVLARTWHQWALSTSGSRAIDLDDYEHESVGTAKSALSKHADEAYNSLSALQATVERVFEAITQRTANGSELRRPLEFRRLCDVVGGDSAAVLQVIDRYRRPDTAFLMPPSEVGLTDSQVIDISHESLIRQWNRLHLWAQEDAESTAMLMRVVDAARQSGGGRDALWRGAMLKRGLEWSRRAAPTPAWVGLRAGGDGAATWSAVEAFLTASSKQARRERRRWSVLIAAASVLALAVLGVVALGAIDAYSRQRQTMSRELVNRALLEVDREPARAARLALAAAKEDPGNPSADFALRQALADLDIAHTESILPLGRPVRDARYSRDGRQLVIASGDTVDLFDASGPFTKGQSFHRDAELMNAWLVDRGSLLVTETPYHAQWQRISEKDPHELQCAQGRIYTVALSPDERWIGAGCDKGDVMVWDAARPDQAPQRFSHAGNDIVTAVAFSYDGAFVASGSSGGSVQIWKMGTDGPWIGRRAGSAVSPIVHAAGKTVTDLAFHPTDNELLVTSGENSEAIVWQLDLARRSVTRAGKEPPPWRLPHDRAVTKARFAPREGDDSPLFTVSDKVVRFWVDQKPDVSQVRAHDDWVVDANASPDGELLVSASSDGTARLWSTRSGALLASLRGHSSALTRASFSPDGHRILTSSDDGTVRIWAINPPRLLWHGKKWMLSAAFSPAGREIAVSDEGDGAVLDPAELSSTLLAKRRDLRQTDPQDQIYSLSWSHDGDLLAGMRSTYSIYTVDKPVVLWDVKSGREVTPDWMEHHHDAVFAPKLDELLTLDEQGRIVVWPFAHVVDPKRPEPTLGPLGKDYSAAALSPDGRWIAAIASNAVDLWDRNAIAAGPRKLSGHQGAVRSVEFSPDSRSLVSASYDRTARIWPVTSTAPAKVLTGGHSAALSSATFSPDGTLIATSSMDRTIRLWKSATAEPLAVLHWHGESVNRVQFSKDGQWLLSASDDGTVKLGQCRPCMLTTAELVAMVPSLAVMTADEADQVDREIAQSTARFSLSALFSRRR